MRWILVIAYLLSMSMRANSETLFEVKEIVDGDTIKILNENKKEIVRLIGVDAPEKKQKFGLESKEYLIKKLLNKKVYLELDKKDLDIYNRKLRYVYINSEMINESIIKEGFGYRSYVYPNKKYDLTFIKAEIEAKNKKLNIWSINEMITPKQFRSNKNK